MEKSIDKKRKRTVKEKLCPVEKHSLKEENSKKRTKFMRDLKEVMKRQKLESGKNNFRQNLFNRFFSFKQIY